MLYIEHPPSSLWIWMYFEGNEATVNRYDAQASGASNWSGVWGGSVRVVVVVSIGVVWRWLGKFL